MDNALYYKVRETPKSLGNRNFSIFILVLGESLWYMLSNLTKTPSDCVGCVGMANQNMLISNSYYLAILNSQQKASRRVRTLRVVIWSLGALTQHLRQPLSASPSSGPSFPTSLELKSLLLAFQLGSLSNFSSFSHDSFFYVILYVYFEARW